MKNTNVYRIILALILSTQISCVASKKTVSNSTTKKKESKISTTKIQTDTLFNSKQIIHVLSIPFESLDGQTLKIALHKEDLEKTSQRAKENNAIAAINGGFFDVNKGGSVTYIENNDTVISKNSPSNTKWGKPESLINAAIVFTKQQELKIESSKGQDFYSGSNDEAFVLVAGPLLLRKSKTQELPKLKLVNKRHPRTCLGKTKDAIVFVCIEGRNENAAGMNLHETQYFLKNIGCVDAINLDGGGSSVLWTKEKGIVNTVSDKKGERLVANSVLLLDK